jgi:hypothetical protein
VKISLKIPCVVFTAVITEKNLSCKLRFVGRRLAEAYLWLSYTGPAAIY